MEPSAADSTISEICQSCRFGSGPERRCTLIEANKLNELLDQGPCKLGHMIEKRVQGLMARRYPKSQNLGPDIAQDAQLKLLLKADSFPGAALKFLRPTERWLEHFIRNHLIDYLRQAKVITKLRCGSCEHFAYTEPQRCTLEFLPERGFGLKPNPWWGGMVTRATNPRRLDPPCDEFQWRRPATFDIFENEVRAPQENRRGEESTFSIIALALDALAKEGDRGSREAVTLSRHYLFGQKVAEIARSSEVSEKTVKRLLSTGRVALAEILKRDFEVEDMADLQF